MDVKFKIFLISTILNILDLLTSIIAFKLGFTELNKWMAMFHNSYVSATVAVVLFELILLGWYVLSKYVDHAKYGMLVFGLTKLYPVIHNTYLLIISFLA
jgi:hypothetical protein